MSKVVMVVVGMALDPPFPQKTYLRSYEPDAYQGRGSIQLTNKPEEAKRFDSLTEAFALWKMQSTATPLRHDGKPNRPLTAYTVTFEPIAE